MVNSGQENLSRTEIAPNTGAVPEGQISESWSRGNSVENAGTYKCIQMYSTRNWHRVQYASCLCGHIYIYIKQHEKSCISMEGWCVVRLAKYLSFFLSPSHVLAGFLWFEIRSLLYRQSPATGQAVVVTSNVFLHGFVAVLVKLVSSHRDHCTCIFDEVRECARVETRIGKSRIYSENVSHRGLLAIEPKSAVARSPTIPICFTGLSRN